MLKLLGRSSLFGLLLLAMLATANAQFEDDKGKTNTGAGPRIDKTQTQKLKIGVEVKAVGGPVKGIHCTLPIPMDWPEQTVRKIGEEKTAGVEAVTYKTLDGGVRQMIVAVPRLPAGGEASAGCELQIPKRRIWAPAETSIFDDAAKPTR